jgi:hypothetical protein
VGCGLGCIGVCAGGLACYVCNLTGTMSTWRHVGWVGLCVGTQGESKHSYDNRVLAGVGGGGRGLGIVTHLERTVLGTQVWGGVPMGV